MRQQLTKTIKYRWTVLDATASYLGNAIDIWTTPYRVRPRDVEGGRHKVTLGLPLLSEDGFKSTKYFNGFHVGDLVTFSLGLTIDPPSVQRFFREGYEWVPVPKEVSIVGKTLQSLFTALWEFDKERFAHFDPAVVVTSHVAAAAANWPQIMPNSPMKIPTVLLNPYNQPWGDLAMLHFEYWENTDLRAELINDLVPGGGVDDVFMDIATGLGASLLWILSDDPWIGVWGKMWPWMLPAQQGVHKIKKVLARKPLRGTPIQALPTTREQGGTSVAEGRRMKIVSMPPPRIELDGFGRQTVWPIRDPVPLLPQPFGRRMHESKLRFRITIPLAAKTTRIEIMNGDSVYYREVHELGEWITPGVHIWTWDGYDQNGIFDSMILKGGHFSARVTVTDFKGRTSVGTTELAVAPSKHRWVDCRVDSNTNQIDVTVWAQFLNPSDLTYFDAGLDVSNLSNIVDTGMGWMASQNSASGGGAFTTIMPSMLSAWPGPAGSQFNELVDEYRNLFVSDGNDPNAGAKKYSGLVPGMLNTGEIEAGTELGRIMESNNVSAERFQEMRTAVMEGIQCHWSRSVTLEGAEWNVVVGCKERAVDANRTYLQDAEGWIGDLRASFKDTEAKKEKERGRSFNLSLVEGLPTFITSKDNTLPQSHVDNGWVTSVFARVGRVGAHEMGHQVLIDRKDWYFSSTHKGTGNLAQERLPTSPNKIVPDAAGNANWEIDVMYYYNEKDEDYPKENWQKRVKGAEEDVCVLVSMARVSFGG